MNWSERVQVNLQRKETEYQELLNAHNQLSTQLQTIAQRLLKAEGAILALRMLVPPDTVPPDATTGETDA